MAARRALSVGGRSYLKARRRFENLARQKRATLTAEPL